MTAALWLGTYLLHSTVLCGSMVLFRRKLRQVNGAEHLWRAAMVLPLISATVSQFAGFGLWEIGVAVRPLEAAASTPVEAAAQWTLFDVWIAAAIVSFATGALLMLRDWVSHIVFERSLGRRTPADRAVTRQVGDLLRDQTGRSIELTCAPGAVRPMVLGPREICLPVRAARDLTHDQLRALVAHEVAHVIRRDHFWFAAMAYLESAMFVQPLNRIGRRELRHLAELSCDDWAARKVSDPMVVAQCLVEVAGWSRSASPDRVPAAAATCKGLTERVQRLIEPRIIRTRMALMPSMVVLCLAALVLPGVAVTFPIIGQHSAEYMKGYELGRAYKARSGASASPAGADDVARAATREYREQLERSLMASQSKTR